MKKSKSLNDIDLRTRLGRWLILGGVWKLSDRKRYVSWKTVGVRSWRSNHKIGILLEHKNAE